MSLFGVRHIGDVVVEKAAYSLHYRQSQRSLGVFLALYFTGTIPTWRLCFDMVKLRHSCQQTYKQPKIFLMNLVIQPI